MNTEPDIPIVPIMKSEGKKNDSPVWAICFERNGEQIKMFEKIQDGEGIKGKCNLCNKKYVLLKILNRICLIVLQVLYYVMLVLNILM